MELDLQDECKPRGEALPTSNLLLKTIDKLTHDRVIPAEAAVNYPADQTFGQGPSVISQIEDIFESIADSILKREPHLLIKLKRRQKPSYNVHNTTVGVVQDLPDVGMKAIKFPSRKPHEAWKFAAVLRILELSHEALVTNTVATKRDIYYRDPKLFIRQTVVDRYVDDIAFTFGIDRDALNIVAAAKGLIAGHFTIVRKNGSIVDYTSELDGHLIPNTKEIQALQLIDISWILIIEKEATFRTLSTGKYWASSFHGNGILLTAKGYPDIQTRQLIFYLHSKHPQIPIYGLVDFDPDGLGIMSTYKYGSAALAHCNERLAVPEVRWLGVKSDDIMCHGNTLSRDNDLNEVASGQKDRVGLLRITPRDRRIARGMLGREMWGEEGRETVWRRELQVMLMLNVKAEIQILSQTSGGLEGWLNERLGELA